MSRNYFNGQFRERLYTCWVEIKENLGRSFLQTLAVILGVASVLGGFSISDSFRRQTQKQIMKMGEMDKLHVQSVNMAIKHEPTALQMANLGLRREDLDDARALEYEGVKESSGVKSAHAWVRSPQAEQDREITGAGVEYPDLSGYALDKGRLISTQDIRAGLATAVLGSEAAATFFPHGDALGKILKIDEFQVQVVGIYKERVFRYNEGGPNYFSQYNTLIHVPLTFMQKRMEGDDYERVDSLIFKIPDLDVMSSFSDALTGVITKNHRQQSDFRIDDVGRRLKKVRSQENMYDLIFMLSGVLAIVGGGIVNVNIQLASLRERVREVGVKMAIGAGSREVFKEFMTEAMLITLLSAIMGVVVGVAFSWMITDSLKVPLFMEARSFLWSFLLAMTSGFLFALYPAWKASRQSPMEALRYE